MLACSAQSLVDMMQLVKGEVDDLVHTCGSLEMWVQLNSTSTSTSTLAFSFLFFSFCAHCRRSVRCRAVPKIQDQKGMSESVKEEIADMLSNGKSSGDGDCAWAFSLSLVAC